MNQNVLVNIRGSKVEIDRVVRKIDSMEYGDTDIRVVFRMEVGND